jgi:hypothetical protein
MTNDYGQHWTLLTDGANGIPADQPMHVVREDPEQEGLLYAGTLQGAFVSFDQGRHWQTLQQNLPATPVTDFKVHHGDLLASTMGRSFWIMDDVAPLRQIAASVMKTTRPRPTDNPNGQVGRVDRIKNSEFRIQNSWHEFHIPNSKFLISPSAADAVLASMQPTTAVAAKPVAPRPAIKPFDGSNVFLFTPSPTYRTRYVAMSGRPDVPEYPPVGARIDYYLPSPPGELRLDILDAAGKVVRSFSSVTAARGGGRGGGRRAGNIMSTLPTKTGMNRFVWDLRYPGGPPASGGDTEGGASGGSGPLVAPGAFKARLTAGAVTRTEPLVVKIDPRVAKDGVTVADLAEQTTFALRLRDLAADARQLAQRVRQALDARRGDQAKLQSFWERLTTKSGPYEDQMFIDQVSNIGREVNQADQKVGASAYERLNDLMKEWTTLKPEAETALR